MYQSITIVGNVGGDPEFRYTPQGVAVADFSVAVSRKTGKGEDRKETTTWFRVTVWRERAETVQQYVKKGMKIMVVGEVSTHAWIDKNSGEARSSLDITANNFTFLSSKAETEAASGEASYSSGGTNQSGEQEESMDIPF